MERNQDIQRHRFEMIAERQRKEKEEQETNRELLHQKRSHDLQVNSPYILSMPVSVAAVPPDPAGEGQERLPGGQGVAGVPVWTDGREGGKESGRGGGGERAERLQPKSA